MDKKGREELNKCDGVEEEPRKRIIVGEGSEDSGAKWSREFNNEELEEEEENQGVSKGKKKSQYLRKRSKMSCKSSKLEGLGSENIRCGITVLAMSPLR